MSFQDDLNRADAIREIRASGCTMPGVAELIVEHFGAMQVLTNIPGIQKLGEELAASDTENGAKMRALLQQAAKTTITEGHETPSSKPDESQAVPDTTIGVETGFASDAAVDADTSGDATAAAGNSAVPTESAASGEEVPVP